MQLLQILKIVLSLLPLILDAVRAVEAALPDGGQGAAKLRLVREVVEAGFKTAADITVQFESAWPAIERAVGAVVSFYNGVGAFRK